MTGLVLYGKPFVKVLVAWLSPYVIFALYFTAAALLGAVNLLDLTSFLAGDWGPFVQETPVQEVKNGLYVITLGLGIT